MKKLFLIMFLGAFTAISANTEEKTPKQKDINAVVFLTSADKYESAFLQTSGLSKTLAAGEKADIELVIGGAAVAIFKQNDKTANELKAKIEALTKMRSVRVVACMGAMGRANVKASDLPKNVGTVKAAPREVVEKQLNGYAVLIP